MRERGTGDQVDQVWGGEAGKILRTTAGQGGNNRSGKTHKNVWARRTGQCGI